MKIKRTTPRDLLSSYGGYEPCKTEQKMTLYVAGTAVCPDCDTKRQFFFDLDKAVFHECNQGNRVTYIPKLADFLKQS
jgi:hypothetical protein